MTTRREFLGAAAVSAVGLSIPGVQQPVRGPDTARQPRGFFDIRRQPDLVLAQTATYDRQPAAHVNGRWSLDLVTVTVAEHPDSLNISLSAQTPVRRIHLRWRGDLRANRLIHGDAWERAYGDLEWRGWAPDRVMPWYFAMFDGSLTHAYGVRTGARALCFWQVDPTGVSLWADVRSGGAPLQLGERTLDVCDIVCRAGRQGESAFAAVHAFCRQMCANPRLPGAPLYGSNDWYWAYGNNSAESVRTDAKRIVDLSPGGGNRPFAVIDDGWQPERGTAKTGVGTWDHGNEKFPDLPGLAAEVRSIGARPGIWVRPLQATADAPAAWRLPRNRNVLDPTIPEVLQKVADDIGRLRQWGFDLIKHDYTTFDILGRWGSAMGAAPTSDGWTFASGPTRTSAEVINDLYRAIRTAADSCLVIGCNTVSHLSAGQFEICRIGDDTSGTSWSRTRKMGVNSLAFRGAQHGAFYVADADCVGATRHVSWALNRQWLDLLARSGTMTFVSIAPDALDADRLRDIKAALAIAAAPRPLAEPLDWQQSIYPARWRMSGEEHIYDWVGADGAGPP